MDIYYTLSVIEQSYLMIGSFVIFCTTLSIMKIHSILRTIVMLFNKYWEKSTVFRNVFLIPIFISFCYFDSLNWVHALLCEIWMSVKHVFETGKINEKQLSTYYSVEHCKSDLKLLIPFIASRISKIAANNLLLNMYSYCVCNHEKSSSIQRNIKATIKNS